MGLIANEQAMERQPLLGQQDNRSDEAATETATSEPTGISRRGLVTIALLFLLQGMSQFSDKLTDLGANEIVEGILCRMIHGQVDNPLKDPRCKDTAVQSEFSRLMGWVYALSTIPGLLTTVPWGIAAEKYGRRPILFLSLFGLSLFNIVSLLIYRTGVSIYWVWPLCLVMFIGGGPSVLNALILTMMSDILPQSYRANAYLYLNAMPVIFLLVQGPLGYELMKKGHWATAYAGIGCYLATCALCLVIPETHGTEESKTVNNDDGQDAQPIGLLQRITNGLKQTAASFHAVFGEDKTLGMLTFSTAFADLGLYAALFLMQYLTKRLNLSWGEANLLLTVRNVAKLVLSFVVLPAVGSLLVRSGKSTIAKDLWICRGCAIAFAIGSFGIGFARTIGLFIPVLVLYSCYNGYLSALQSVLSQVAGEDKRAVTFTVVGLMDYFGRLAAGPSLAWAYKIGLEMGGYWTGLPFDVAGCFMILVVIVLFAVRSGRLQQGPSTQI